MDWKNTPSQHLDAKSRIREPVRWDLPRPTSGGWQTSPNIALSSKLLPLQFLQQVIKRTLFQNRKNNLKCKICGGLLFLCVVVSILVEEVYRKEGFRWARSTRDSLHSVSTSSAVQKEGSAKGPSSQRKYFSPTTESHAMWEQQRCGPYIPLRGLSPHSSELRNRPFSVFTVRENSFLLDGVFPEPHPPSSFLQISSDKNLHV